MNLKALIEQAQAGDIKARNAIVEKLMPRIEIEAKKMAARTGEEYGLFVSEGFSGAVRAIERFDTSRPVKFWTYAHRRIKGAMIDQLRSDGQVKRRALLMNRDMAAAVERVEAREMRKAKDAEVAEEMGVSLARLWDMARQARAGAWNPVNLSSVKLSAQGYESNVRSGDLGIETRLADHRIPEPWERCAREDLVELIFRSVRPRNRLVLSLYFWEGYTLREIGEVLSVSESRVSYLIRGVLRKLRKHLPREVAA